MGPSKQLIQIIQIEHIIVKNPNWLEASQFAIYKSGRGFELRATVKQIQLVVRVGLEPGTTWLRVWHADHSAILPQRYAATFKGFGPSWYILNKSLVYKKIR